MSARRFGRLILGIGIMLMGLALLAARPAHAATSDEPRSILVRTTSALVPGDRIRVVLRDTEDRAIGWFATVEGDSALQMRLTKDDQPVSIGFPEIGSLEKRVGTTHHAGAGAVVGLLIGVIAGVAVSQATQDSFIHPPTDISAAGGALAGMILGGLVGACITTDRYELVAEAR